MDQEKPINSLIRDLGGARAIAVRLQKKESAIRQWAWRGHVPWRFRAAVRHMAAERGLSLTAEQDCLLSLMEASAA